MLGPHLAQVFHHHSDFTGKAAPTEAAVGSGRAERPAAAAGEGVG